MTFQDILVLPLHAHLSEENVDKIRIMSENFVRGHKFDDNTSPKFVFEKLVEKFRRNVSIDEFIKWRKQPWERDLSLIQPAQNHTLPSTSPWLGVQKK
jgi:hypothetical protein